MTAGPLEPLAPRYVADRMAPLHRELVALLRALDPRDWSRPTMAGGWTVHDVAGHLLDGDLRKLSAYRDAHLPEPPEPIRTDRDLVRFINAQNAVGVQAIARFSPRVITDLLEASGAWVSDLFLGLAPHAPSLFPVSWAGEAESENWMDTGREYTERWHHQAQIRAAVGATPLLDAAWFEPVLDFSVRALPVAYRDVVVPAGASVTLVVSGGASWAWSVVRGSGRWQVFRGRPASPSAVVHLADADVWRVFHNAMDLQTARSVSRIEGDHALGEVLLSARSVIV